LSNLFVEVEYTIEGVDFKEDAASLLVKRILRIFNVNYSVKRMMKNIVKRSFFGR